MARAYCKGWALRLIRRRRLSTSMVLWTVWVEWKARGEFRSSVGNLWIMELVGSVFRIACGAQYGCLPMRMVWKHARTQAGVRLCSMSRRTYGVSRIGSRHCLSCRVLPSANLSSSAYVQLSFFSLVLFFLSGIIC